MTHVTINCSYLKSLPNFPAPMTLSDPDMHRSDKLCLGLLLWLCRGVVRVVGGIGFREIRLRQAHRQVYSGIDSADLLPPAWLMWV